MKVPASLLILAAACGPGNAKPDDSRNGAANMSGRAPEDSLALTAPGGVEVWYTLSRPGRAPDGRACVDRALEIRREGRRIPVPLLYTGTAPELVNDTLVRARLSRDCEPTDRYLVDLRTGRPTPER